MRTIAVFSKEFEEANTDVKDTIRRNGSVRQLEGDMVDGLNRGPSDVNVSEVRVNLFLDLGQNWHR